MLKNCGGGPRPLGCVLKRLKILMKFNSAGPVGKNDPYMLKNCGGGPRPIRLCVEKT